MSLEWIHENPPHWDDPKSRIVGAVPKGSFQIDPHTEGDLISGEWWRVERAGEIVGYGWMDTVWGDGEVLLVVDPAQQKQGIGGFILERLEAEGVSRGLNYLYNAVPEGHPDKKGVARWLTGRGFEPRGDGRLMKRVGLSASSD